MSFALKDGPSPLGTSRLVRAARKCWQRANFSAGEDELEADSPGVCAGASQGGGRGESDEKVIEAACKVGDFLLAARKRLAVASGWARRLQCFFFGDATPAEVPVEMRPLLVENQDSFSVNCSKAFYLLGQRGARYIPVWDLFHKRHNMKLAAYKRSGLFSSIRLQMAVFEVFRGPWGGYAFWRQSVESMQAYLRLADPDDPILELEYEAICRARGQDPFSADKAAIMDDMRAAKWLHVLAPKSCSSRWCSFEDSQRFWEPHLPERLCGARYLGIQQGWHEKKKDLATSMAHHMAGSAADKASGSGEKEGMAATTEKETKARSKCVNGLHFAAVVMANDDIQFDCRAARYMARPQVAVHKTWSHDLKSPDQGTKLAIELASGALSHRVLKETFTLLADAGELERIGLQVDFSGKRWKGLATDSPEVQNEDELMGRLYSLGQNFCQEEIIFLAMWRSAFPYAFAGLLQEDAAMTDTVLRRARCVADAYAEAKTSTMQVWKGIVKESCLSWTINSETFQLLEAEGYKLTDRVLKQVRRVWAHMMSSLLSERGFKWMRDCQRDNNNALVSQLTLWECPSRRSVLGNHKYDEISASRVHDVGKDSISKSMFGPPVFRKSSDTFWDVPGKGGKPPWHSPRPEDIPLAGVATDFLIYSFESDSMEKAAASWRTGVAQVGSVIFRKSKPGAKFFCVAKAVNLMYLWPARADAIGKSTFYS